MLRCVKTAAGGFNKVSFRFKTVVGDLNKVLICNLLGRPPYSHCMLQ